MSLQVAKITMMASATTNLTSLLDDKEIMKQILAIHAPENVVVDVQSLFVIIKDILDRSYLVVDAVSKGLVPKTESGETKINENFDFPSDIISKISCEIGCNASAGADETTKSVLKTLSGYSWDAKVVLTLAALALKYGDLWFLAHIHPSHPFAKSMAVLKQLPALMKPSGPQKDRLVALNTLIKNVLEVTECIVKLEKVSSKHTVTEVPALASVTHIPSDVYWTIRTVVICATQISNLVTKGQVYSPQELAPLANQISKILSKLGQELDDIKRNIVEIKRYKMIVKLSEGHSDIVEVLKLIIVTKDNILVHGTTMKTVKIDDLRRKNVLLFISGIEITTDELLILIQIYEKSKPSQGEDNQFEIVWMPIVEQWKDDMKEKFEKLQSKMPWYTVQYPSAINGAAIWFIKDYWHFKYQPIVVVLDPRGKVECPNAIPMMRIWGKDASPYSDEKEIILWRQKAWVELLASIISPETQKLMMEGKFIFWYGGNDIKWIQEFEKQAKRVKDDGISITIFNPTKIPNFWTYLESFLLIISKLQTQFTENHIVMQEIQKLLHYKLEGTWTMLTKGTQFVTTVDGIIAVETLTKYDTWKTQAAKDGLDLPFKTISDEKMAQLSYDPKGCFLLSFPTHTGKIPESYPCPTCNQVAEKLVTFKCCHNAGDVGNQIKIQPK